MSPAKQRTPFQAQHPKRPRADMHDAYCELCGRVHAGRWECRERAERSGEAVRLFLIERGEL